MKELLTDNPEIMIRLYASGAFPMADDKDGDFEWYYPKIRTIIPLNNYNIPRSLMRVIKKNLYNLKYDNNVMGVVHNCAKREKTWISKSLIDAYKKIYNLGYLHSVEVYNNDELIGGLYGVSIRGCFFGESMFSTMTNASKIALYYLIQRLVSKNFSLLDVQFITPHLAMFGAIEISLSKYNRLLKKGLETDTEF